MKSILYGFRNIHTHTKYGHCKFQGGGESQKPNFEMESMKLNLKFQGERDYKTNNHPWWGYEYFLELNIEQ